MGCDIHCYIEYKENDRWRSFGGCINPGRNYWMFAETMPHLWHLGKPEDVRIVFWFDN